VGASTRSWDAAVTDAVRGAKKDAPDPIAVEVGRLWADLDAKQAIRRYRASVRIAYRQAIAVPARERPAGSRRGRAPRA
jgi:flavin-binding protein dodecin